MNHSAFNVTRELNSLLLLMSLWPLITTLLCWRSGYLQLRKHHPPVDEPLAQRFSSVSGKLGGVPINNAFHVGLGEQGLHLSLFLLFRLTAPPGLPCIPWEDLLCTRVPRRSRKFWGSHYDFEVRSLSLRFSLAGPAGVAVARRLGHA